MRNSSDDIPAWLASLSHRTLRRLSSRLCYVARLVDVELQRRDSSARSSSPNDRAPTDIATSKTHG